MPKSESAALPDEVSSIFERYRENAESYRAAGYKEYRLRQEFIDPLFEALGWDIRNRAGFAEPYKDEVTKLSLLLKVLEGASGDQIASQLNLFRARALPDLGLNIRCGNSLVEMDYFAQDDVEHDEEAVLRVRPFDWQAFIGTATDSRGFDAIIGNPPYVLLQDRFRQKALEPYYKQKYNAATFKLDYYPLFVERALGLTSKNGRASFIVPSNFLTNNNSITLRRLLLTKGLEKVLIFNGRVFARASVDTCIFLVSGKAKHRKLRVQRAKVNTGAGFAIERETTLLVDDVLSDRLALISAADRADTAILQKMIRSATPLGRMASVNFGKQLRDRERFPTEVIELSAREKAPVGYAECYTGKDIHRFRLSWSGLACKTARTSKAGGCWDDAKQNAKDKLLCRQVGRWPTFGLDVVGRQCLNTLFMINPNDPNEAAFLLGLLNSKPLAFFWLKKFYDHRNTFPKIKGTYLKLLPVPAANAKTKQDIATIAMKLVDLEERIAHSSSSHHRPSLMTLKDQFEKKLHVLVLTLFGLDSAEGEHIANELAKY